MQKKKIKYKWLYTLLLVLGLAIFLRLFVAEVCFIKGTSMEPTLSDGDWLWVEKSQYGALLPERFSDIPILNLFTWNAYLRNKDKEIQWNYRRTPGYNKPKINDLIVFKSPLNPEEVLVKRIKSILSQGDLLKATSDRFLLLASVAKMQQDTIEQHGDEIFLNGEKILFYRPQQTYYYVLGDNAANSVDSRTFGYVPEQNLIGKGYGLNFFSKNR